MAAAAIHWAYTYQTLPQPYPIGQFLISLTFMCTFTLDGLARKRPKV